MIPVLFVTSHRLRKAIICLLLFEKWKSNDDKGKAFNEMTHEHKHDPARSKGKASWAAWRPTASICLWNQVSSAAQTPSEEKLRMMPELLLLTQMQTIKILNPYENFFSILGLQSLLCLSLPQIGHSQNSNYLIIIQLRMSLL